jgi:ribosomal protein L11 methyltransferase
MPWLQASFELAVPDPEPVADALLEAGAVSVELTDAEAGTSGERPLFGEPGADVANWPRQRVAALFSGDADARALVSQVLGSFDIAMPDQICIEAVAEQDWVRATQQQFGPIRISERLWIVPSWSEAPDGAAINLKLDPGLAFGTGSHPTTAQCLLWLEANLPTGATLIDYGCGSGVLAIAARRLGAGRVVAVDIDPAALTASRANAALNAVDIEVVETHAVDPGPYDVVMANILSNPLKVLAPLLSSLVRRDGALVLAGILTSQAQEVAHAYRPWMDLHPVFDTEGWTCLAGRRTR